MQISNNSSASALIQYRTNSASSDHSNSTIQPANTQLSDKQSNPERHSKQPNANTGLSNNVQNQSYINIHRINPTASMSHQALANTRHSAQKAVSEFQQIDLLSNPELMHRIDTMA